MVRKGKRCRTGRNLYFLSASETAFAGGRPHGHVLIVKSPRKDWLATQSHPGAGPLGYAATSNSKGLAFDTKTFYLVVVALRQ